MKESLLDTARQPSPTPTPNHMQDQEGTERGRHRSSERPQERRSVLKENVTDFPDWSSTLHGLFSGSRVCQWPLPVPSSPRPASCPFTGHLCPEDRKEHQVPLVRPLGDPGRQQAGGRDTSPVAQGLGTKVSVMNYSLELC